MGIVKFACGAALASALVLASPAAAQARSEPLVATNVSFFEDVQLGDLSLSPVNIFHDTRCADPEFCFRNNQFAISVILFTLFAPPLAAFALKFGPQEEFALMVLAFATFIGLGGDDARAEERGRDALLAQLGERTLRTLSIVRVVDRDLRPRATEVKRHGLAEARRGARDEGDSSFEVEHGSAHSAIR